MLNKKLITILVVVVVILVAVSVWIGMRLNKSDEGSRASAYSVVMLANGDVYFGKFIRFPSPKITNAWILQRSLDNNNQVQLSVVPANRAFWSPVDEVNLNPDQIVSWTRLRKDSRLINVLENPDLLTQPQGAQGAQGAGNAVPGGSAATSTAPAPSGAPPRQ
jgi:hypothetical protein